MRLHWDQASLLFFRADASPLVFSLKLFQRRKPSVTKEWQNKLPDFVRRLEEALYRSAQSKVGEVAGAAPPRGRAEAGRLRLRWAAFLWVIGAGSESARRGRARSRAVLLFPKLADAESLAGHGARRRSTTTSPL